jgi:hypothetical protein
MLANSGERWNGAQGRNRTTDTRIFSPLLYRLSYLGGATGKRGGLVEEGTVAVQRGVPALSWRGHRGGRAFGDAALQ